jgi:hypothetical protein
VGDGRATRGTFITKCCTSAGESVTLVPGGQDSRRDERTDDVQPIDYAIVYALLALIGALYLVGVRTR